MIIQDQHWKDWVVEVVDSEHISLPECKVDRWPARNGDPAYTKLYLECKDNQKFRVIVRRPFDTPAFDTGVELWVDGHRVSKNAMVSTKARTHFGSISEEIDGEVCRRALWFSPLRTGDSVKLSSEDLQKLGTIEVRLGRHEYRLKAEKSLPTVHSEGKEFSTVDEKMKKERLTSFVGGGKTRAAKAVSKYSSTSCDYPQYKVIFKYRTRPALELLKVIPGSQEQTQTDQEGAAVAHTKKSHAKRKNPSSVAVALSDGNDDDDIVPIAGSKHRKIEIIDLVSDTDNEEEKPKVVLSNPSPSKRWDTSKKKTREGMDDGLTIKEELLDKFHPDTAGGTSKQT